MANTATRLNTVQTFIGAKASTIYGFAGERAGSRTRYPLMPYPLRHHSPQRVVNEHFSANCRHYRKSNSQHPTYQQLQQRKKLSETTAFSVHNN